MTEYKLVLVFKGELNQELYLFDHIREYAAHMLGPNKGTIALYEKIMITLERDIIEKDRLIKADKLRR